MFKNKLRHSKRLQEIINVFLKNGLSHFLFRLGLTKQDSMDSEPVEHVNLHDIGVKLRQALQELGPTFIKLGQIASTRRDLVPPEISIELAKLQDHVTPFPFEQVKEIIEYELGAPISQVFSYFNPEPLATASIGQVHEAQLPSGEQVAVKVQRPNIRPIVDTDLSILADVARFLEDNTDWAETYHLRDMMDEFSSTLTDELDYRIEGRNGERIAKQFAGQPDIHIPAVYWDFSTDKVLTAEMLQGIKSNDVQRLDAEGYDRRLIAQRIVDSMFFQVLEMGFFHGDPHPGNISIQSGNIISYMDFGMVGRLPDELKFHFASLIVNMRNGDTDGMIDTFDEMGILPDDLDMRMFKRDLDTLQTKYYDVSLNEIHMGAIFMELFQVAYRHHILIPSEISILGKAILTLEGLISELDPKFSIMKAVEPFGEKLMKERYNPLNLAQESIKQWMENYQILTHLPKDLKDITRTIKKGKLQLDINVKQTHTFLNRLDQISNRLSFSIILLSFSILMVGVIIGSAIAGERNLLWDLPVIEAGSIIAGLMFLFLLYRIFRSGKM
ncbi:AarF/ABC1/UbiB kinase family protein [Sporosarcina sp. Te-1]|uniref:ABC1 kinase family protein n=1 Tax=Sporosarcina sp. Te-1 TaxID=2818390 RepID=UPI001A9D2999|nr:AarF/ABC1/UbiB kinase family protein [Sporosarcina sp. Te-1]QTD40069.1 AarF/ABC1/UbiB kinase family protein [Sporosarcina sp. Te-1]